MSSAEIFICYARKDIRRVKEVMDWIEKNGISSSQIFFDQQNIYGASNCANVISQAIQDCKVLVFFVSKSSVQSRWVSNEIYFALGKEKSVLPLFLEPTELPSCLQLFLGMINQLFLYEGDRKATLNHVMRSIARLDVTVANKQCGVRQAEPFSSHCRVFDENGRLQKDVFAFPILDILIRAAKRMNFHGRTRVTFYDFTAGLVRKGQLMRYVLVQCRINPDRLYERISALPELPDEVEPVRSEEEEFTGTQYKNSENAAKRKLRELLEKWMVNKKDRFHPRLSDCLVNIDLSFQKTHSTTADDRLTEESVIRGLVSLGEWRRLASEGLPDADTISGVLLERQRLAYFDENGFLSRELLDESAWEVVKTAQKLSQKKGVSVITNRVLLAACIQNENNYGTRVFREAGARPDFFFEMLLSTLSGHSSVTFELGIEVCSRIVIPVIRHAQKLAGRLKGITEKELFVALCDTIAPNLKEQFRKPPISIDLDSLKTVKPSKESFQSHNSGMVEKAKRKNMPEAELESDIRDVEYREEDFEPDVNEIMSNAVHRAAKDGWPEVKTPHLFAEMIDAATGPLGKYLSKRGLDADQLKKIILSTVSSEDENDEEIEPTKVKMSANVRKLLAGGRKRAVLNGRQRTGQNDLYASFFSDGGGIVGEILKRLGLGKLMHIIPENMETDRNSKTDDPPVSRLVNKDDFTPNVLDIISRSMILAGKNGWQDIRSPHLFASMIDFPNGELGRMLKKKGIRQEILKQLILSVVPPQGRLQGDLAKGISASARNILKYAHQNAMVRGWQKVGETDLLKAFFSDKDGIVCQILIRTRLEVLISEIMGQWSHSSAIDRTAKNDRERVESNGRSMLDQFGIDLTEKAKNGELLDAIGRDREIETVMHSLMLTENANPLLIGEAGVGKSTIAWSIAKRIAEGSCPPRLRSMRMVELSADSLIADTGARGQFEQRIQQLLEEAASKKVILFIDEIHMVIGSGPESGGKMNAGNMLKSSLARGDVRIMGATTQNEYKACISSDRGMVRRFQIHVIYPPSREATVEILSSLKKKLEEHHHVRITDQAVESAVDISGRYILNRHWPTKARDVLDRACILTATEHGVKDTSSSVPQVEARHSAEVVSKLTGLPVQNISRSEIEALSTLEQRIGKRIVGQQEAIRTICNAISRGRQGLGRSNRPWGVFLFTGPPGVGKTELARTLAEEVFDGPESLIRFDMGNFTEAHSTARLIGSPPGYVGYDKGAPLVEQLRVRPYSLVLFDEIEHAHENVLSIMLRLFSEGMIVDSDGIVADARNTIIIMTSNILETGSAKSGIGFNRDTESNETQTALREMIRKHFSNKFVDRLDAVVRFNRLNRKNLAAVAGMTVKRIAANAGRIHNVSLSVDEEVLYWIADRVAESGEGARAVHREVDVHIVDPVGTLLNSEAAENSKIRIVLENNQTGIRQVR